MSDAALGIGRRILVTGMAGSGKSTFSRSLAAKTGLPVIHLDLHFWKPGWVAPSELEWRDKQRGLLAGDAWIADGNYHETLDLRLERADTVVFLDTPWWVCARRAFLRGLREAGRGDARRLRRFVLAKVARRVAFGHRHLAEPPLRARARTRDHLAVRAARGPSRARVQTGS